MQKFLIVLIALIILGVGAYYFAIKPPSITPPVVPQSQTAPTPPAISGIDISRWLIFKSEKFGYEIKYPNGAEIYNRDDGGRFAIDMETYLHVPTDLIKARDKAVGGLFGLSAGLVIIQEDNPQHLSIRDWVYQNVHEQKQAPEPRLEKDVTFLGEPAYYFEYDYSGRGGLYAHIRYSIYFFHNNFLYQIAGVKPPAKATDLWKKHPYYSYLQQSVPISDAIIKSFRFTDKP